MEHQTWHQIESRHREHSGGYAFVVCDAGEPLQKIVLLQPARSFRICFRALWRALRLLMRPLTVLFRTCSLPTTGSVLTTPSCVTSTSIYFYHCALNRLSEKVLGQLSHFCYGHLSCDRPAAMDFARRLQSHLLAPKLVPLEQRPDRERMYKRSSESSACAYG